MGEFENKAGQKYGRLTVLDDYIRKPKGNTGKKEIYWHCKCECGTEKYVSSYNLKKGLVKSCGCLSRELSAIKAKKIGKRAKKDLTGTTIDYLTVIEDTGVRTRKNGAIIWKCKCKCGKETEKPSYYLLQNRNVNTPLSCGCMTLEIIKKDISGRKFGKLTAIYPTEQRRGTSVVWYCVCDCGNHYYTDASSLVDGSCLSCGCVRSKGEMVIAKILDEHGIKYEREKSFSSCRFPETNAVAKFDFYVEEKYIIEFDGIQHIKETKMYNRDNY